MADEPLWGSLVVEGRHHQQSVHTGAGGVPGQGDGVFRIVGAGPGDDRDPAVHVSHHGLDGAHALLIAHGGGLAGGAADDDGVRAVLQLEVQQAGQGGVVDAAIGKGRDDGHAGAGKNRLFHKLPPDDLFLLLFYRNSLCSIIDICAEKYAKPVHFLEAGRELSTRR